MIPSINYATKVGFHCCLISYKVDKWVENANLDEMIDHERGKRDRQQDRSLEELVTC